MFTAFAHTFRYQSALHSVAGQFEDQELLLTSENSAWQESEESGESSDSEYGTSSQLISKR